jgi:hypothetical protein
MAGNENKKVIRKKDSVNVAIPVDLHDRFDAWCSKRDRIKVRTLARLVEFFLGEPDAGKKAILAESIEGLEPAHADLLRRMAPLLFLGPFLGCAAVFARPPRF